MNHLENLVPDDVVKATMNVVGRRLQARAIAKKLERQLPLGKRERLEWELSWLKRKDQEEEKLASFAPKIQPPVQIDTKPPYFGTNLFAPSPFQRMPEGEGMRSHPIHQ